MKIMVFPGSSPSNLDIQMIVAILSFAKLVCKCPLIMLLTGIMFIYQFSFINKVKISPKWLKKINNWPYLGCYFIHILHTWDQDTPQWGASNDLGNDDQGHGSRSNFQILANISKMGTTWMLFYPMTSYLVPNYNPIRRFQRKRGPSVKIKSQGQNFPKMGKSANNLPYLRCYFPTDFKLDTKAHSMTQVLMTLTFKVKGQGQNFPKMCKSPNNLPYLRCYFSTDFILDTKVPPKKAHSMTQVPMTWTFIQGQG